MSLVNFPLILENIPLHNIQFPELDLSSNIRIYDTNLKGLEKLTFLTKLRISSCRNLTLQSSSCFPSSLQILDISNVNYFGQVERGEIVFLSLHRLLLPASLTDLNLYSTHLSNEGFVVIGKLCPNLIKLDVGKTYVTNNGLHRFFTCSLCSSLKSLRLYGVDYSQDKKSQLTFENVTLSTSIQSLDLSYCKMLTDQGLICIAQQLINLQTLALENCRISSEGIQQLIKCTNLTFLDLAYTFRIDSKTIHLLKTHCPKLKINLFHANVK